MAKGVIDGFNFIEDFSAMRYWSFPSSYTLEKRQKELNDMLYSDNYVGAEKRDGYFERIVKDNDGNVFMISRDKGVNGWLDKHEWVPHLHSFFNDLPNGTCLLGEVYLPNKTSKSIVSILGCLKEKAIARQAKDEDKLRLYIFDILAYEGESFVSAPMSERVNLLNYEYFGYSGMKHIYPFVEIAQYWDNPDEIHENWLRILAEGGEGIVLVRKDYPYEFGKRSARKTLKLKKELQDELSVILTGRWKEPTKLYTGSHIETHPYWLNEVTGQKINKTLSEIINTDGLTPITKGYFYGWAGSLEIGVLSEKTGKIIPIGFLSGLSEEIKRGIIENNREYCGRVCDVQCMEVDYSGSLPSLRHAKFLGFRDDRTIEDATWEKAFGRSEND